MICGLVSGRLFRYTEITNLHVIGVPGGPCAEYRGERMKKSIALLLIVVLLVPFAACGRRTTGADYPAVFVHGYSGWGAYDARNASTPYWGLGSTNVENSLRARDFQVYMASVGPVSSAWDRACELYAQITGTRVDYGAAHSAACGHDRFGRDFTGNALIPDFTWDSAHKIHLIGHSFGGATIRLLLDLLADGDAAEQASGKDVSPLFTGGKADWVCSITTISAPSNGTTAVYLPSSGGSISAGTDGSYDPRLDQFGIYADSTEAADAAMRSAGFSEHYDNALNDMMVDRACSINAQIEMQPDVWYFNYYGTSTVSTDTASVPNETMTLYLRDLAAAIGSYSGVTPGVWRSGFAEAMQIVNVPAQTLDGSWQPNDGMVNGVSAYCPYHLDGAGQRVYDAHADVTEESEYQPGVWNIFPDLGKDHFAVIGGIFTEQGTEVIQFYVRLMNRLCALPG